MISYIKNRDGQTVKFDIRRINDAIEKSFAATEPGVNRRQTAIDLANEVYTLLDLEGNESPALEHIQDVVEQVLMRAGHTKTAKNYILYREEHTRLRAQNTSACTLQEALSGCESVEEAAVKAAQLLQTQNAPTFLQAITPALNGSFLRCYRDAQRLALELLTGSRVNENTQQAWAAGLRQKGLAVTVAADKDALSREADLICGTLGCDRDAVLKAQQYAIELAKTQTKAALQAAVKALCEVTKLPKTALCGDEARESLLL